MNREILKQIEEGASLEEILSQWLETHPQPRCDDAKCEHPQTEIRFKVDSAGRRFYKHQCLVCGGSASNSLPKHMVKRPWEIPPFDTEWEESGRDERYAAYREQSDAWREKRDVVWKGYYQYYIRTDRWRRRSAQCLEDSGGWCERHLRSSGQRIRACHAHHLNYRNLGDEKPEDLAALCQWCHNELHGRKF